MELLRKTFITIGLVGIGYGATLILTRPVVGAVPASVEEQYQQTAAEFSNSLGATLKRCTDSAGAIYVVSGSGGFAGFDYYFDTKGRSIGTYAWDDAVYPDEPQPPVDLSDYKCTAIRSSS